MKIYLDNCVLNRPFDDQTQERIYLETRAFLIILKYIEEEKIELICSIANHYEIDKISDFDRKEKIISYLNLAKFQTNLNTVVENRAKELSVLGFIGMDAVHLALAENAGVDYFITCDDKMLKIGKRNKKRLKLKLVSLFEFIEVIHYVKNN